MSEGAAQAFRRVLHGECITCGQSATEVTALRATVARVREMANRWPYNLFGDDIRRTLDGEP